MTQNRNSAQLREDAIAIWNAGLAAVRSDHLVAQSIGFRHGRFEFEDYRWDPGANGRLVVVGAGKAGSGMVQGFERALTPDGLDACRVTGWVNVPADCVTSTERIRLHAGRPAGINLPTAAAVQGTREILQLVASLTPNDLCVCLLSGGGSALLASPAEGISLEEKQQVTAELSSNGANIRELNTVRKALSQVKGGQLASSCKAASLITLVISDVLGDPLDIIASGPTVGTEASSTEAIEIMRRFEQRGASFPQAVLEHLESATRRESQSLTPRSDLHAMIRVIGNNALAVDAAGIEAEKRGYSHAMDASTTLEGDVGQVATHHARLAERMRRQSGPDCLITGGEPVVDLPPANVRGKGGRNQQLSLLTAMELAKLRQETQPSCDGTCTLSGGTDGEDGPTDAAGAWVDADVCRQAADLQLNWERHAAACDAYSFFAKTKSLLLTGPTHTNVCDLRVVVVDRVQE